MGRVNRRERRIMGVEIYSMAMSAAAVLMLVAGISGTALGAAKSVETVTYMPMMFTRLLEDRP